MVFLRIGLTVERPSLKNTEVILFTIKIKLCKIVRSTLEVCTLKFSDIANNM